MDRGQLGAISRPRASLQCRPRAPRAERARFPQGRQLRARRATESCRRRRHAVHSHHRGARRALGSNAVMPMSSKWYASLFALSLAAGCAPHGPSTVAQGKYYSSAQPRFDEFFIGLFDRQIAMENALAVPSAEQRRLAGLVQLPPPSSIAEIEAKLREQALALSRAGVRLRLD